MEEVNVNSMKNSAVQHIHVEPDNISILQMEDIIDQPLESPPQTDANEIGPPILQREDIVEQPFNIVFKSPPKLNESNVIQQQIDTLERQHELLQTTVKSQLCHSEHIQEKDFRTKLLPLETYEHMQQHIVSTVPQPHSSKVPEHSCSKAKRDQTHTYENQAATSLANSQDSQMTGHSSFVPCFKNSQHLCKSKNTYGQTNSGLEQIMVVHHSQAPLTHGVTTKFLQDHQKTESSSNIRPSSTQIRQHNGPQNYCNLNQTRPQHHLSNDQMYYVNSSHQYMSSGLLGTPHPMEQIIHLLGPFLAYIEEVKNYRTYTEPIQFPSRPPHSVQYYQPNQEHIFRNVYNSQQSLGQMQNSHSRQQINQFGPHVRRNMNFPKLHVPQKQLRQETFSLVYENVGHLSNDAHSQNFTNTDNDFNSNTHEIDLQVTSDRQLVNNDVFDNFDDVKDTKIHSGPPKALNQPATQGLIQNDIRRKLAPQQPHVHQVQTENRHLQSQCLEADNTGIMPRAKLVYKHRKLATHETKQYEQPICSVQQSHSDLNTLQRQSVVQYPTATTKMASSNIQPQLVSDHTIICIMPKDSQQILQVQDFLSDIGQFDWAKIKEHANSFCILPNGRQVSLEIFSKMIEDPNNHSLTNKAVVKIFSNEQSTIDEHQRANTRQQARITTREIKPSEVHQLFIFKDDTSKPQVQMHADCHNSMPMLKPCTAEEFKYLQQNQENNVSHHKNHGFSSSLKNPNPLSSQWSLEDHTISSSIPHMETQPTLEINRDVVSSFVGTITPPSAVDDQKPIKDSQSLKNFQQNAINLGQLQNKQLDNKLQQVQETALQNNPLESAAQYQYIKNTNQDVQQQDGQPKKSILTVENPRENIIEFVSADGQINIAKQSTIKKPKGPKFVQGKLAVCNHCGYSSTDFFSCQRCGKKLPDTIKSVSDDLSEKNRGRIIRFDDKTVIDNSAVNDETKKLSKIMILEPKSKMLKNKEIITLSSSEDEEIDRSNCKDFFTTKYDSNTFQNNNLDSAIAVSAHKKEPKDDSDRVIVNERISKRTRAGSTRIQEPNLSLALECRTVRIGSYKTIPIGNIIISSKSVKMSIPASHRGKMIVNFDMDNSEIVRVLAHLGRSVPVIFFYTTCSSGEIIRRSLKMTKGGPYFDPYSKDEIHRRIVLLPKQLDEELKNTLRIIYTKSFIDLTQKEANYLLLLASPKEVSAVSKADEPQEQPTILISKILTYPPPPAKGGLDINTQDLMCLAPEKYLNDIIIDFFLIYIVETLSAEQREKIHIMGTYFYNKLTQRRASNVFPEETDPNLSPAERRHCRVRGWTKKIDLFKKDFVFIPINEMQHWFLAVICFPGLVEDTIKTNTVTPVTPVTNTNTKRSSQQSKKKAPAHKITKVKVKLNEVSNIRDEANGADSEMEDEVLAIFPSETKEPAADNNLKNTKKSKLKIRCGTPIDKSFKQPCILIFDSMPSSKRTKVVATLREYLQVEYKAKYNLEKKFTRETMKGSTPRVPMQDNLTDCGLFTLQYAESFLMKPVVDFHLPITTLENMFSLEAAKSKRSEIQQIIVKILLETKANIDDLNLPLYYPLQMDTEEQDTVEVADVDCDSMKTKKTVSQDTMPKTCKISTEEQDTVEVADVDCDIMKTKKTVSQDTMPKTCKISTEVSHITILNGKKVAGTPKTETCITQNRSSPRIYLKTKRVRRSATNEVSGEISQKKKRKI